MGRPKPEESEQLRSVAASRTLPHGLVRRAGIILLSASGMSNQAIAARLHLNPVTVSYWRRRFLHQGLPGLHGELRPGRPRSISNERVAALIRKTLQAGSKDATTHWSCRSLAAQTRFENHRPPHLARLWSPAASAALLSTLQRSVLRRECTGYRGIVFEPAGQSRGVAR